MSGSLGTVSAGRVMRVFRFLVLVTAIGAGVLLAAPRAAAHDLNATVDVTNDPAKLLAYFDDDTPAETADVTIADANGGVVLTGKTDERGAWAFPRPKPGAYTLTVKSIGHVAKVSFTVSGAADGTVFTGRRLNKWVGLAIGVTVLLGASGASWLIRRRGRRLE